MTYTTAITTARDERARMGPVHVNAKQGSSYGSGAGGHYVSSRGRMYEQLKYIFKFFSEKIFSCGPVLVRLIIVTWLLLLEL